jgi:RNA polymerase sigma factor (sigma-70 family)
MLVAEQSTDQLLQGCLSGDRRSQKQLYQQFYEFAMSIAMRYSRDEMDAADIMSHAFVKVFRSIKSYDSSKGSLHAWIKRIIVNEGLDHIKTRNRFSENVEIETVAEPEIKNEVLEQMGADEIMKLVQKLPPATHAVFVLYAVEGYTHREIAKKLSISDGTSKWHLSEARKTLQKQIMHLES